MTRKRPLSYNSLLWLFLNGAEGSWNHAVSNSDSLKTITLGHKNCFLLLSSFLAVMARLRAEFHAKLSHQWQKRCRSPTTPYYEYPLKVLKGHGVMLFPKIVLNSFLKGQGIMLFNSNSGFWVFQLYVYPWHLFGFLINKQWARPISGLFFKTIKRAKPDWMWRGAWPWWKWAQTTPMASCLIANWRNSANEGSYPWTNNIIVYIQTTVIKRKI